MRMNRWPHLGFALACWVGCQGELRERDAASDDDMSSSTGSGDAGSALDGAAPVDAGPLHDGSADAVDGGAREPVDAGLAEPDAHVPPCVDDPPEPGAPLASFGSCGRLVYGPYANRDEQRTDNRLPDFSFAGYGGGGVALPNDVPTVITVAPGAGDDRARIQAAIDDVSARTPDARGVRGAVLLERGTYEVSDSLFIKVGGVVLRGRGQGVDGTVLMATAQKQHELVKVQGPGGSSEVSGSRKRITSAYVGVGAASFEVEDAGGFSVGDDVGVLRVPNDAWVDALATRAYGWKPEDYDVAHPRRIRAIEGTRIHIDAPLVDAIADEFGGGFVFRYGPSTRAREVGIEDLRFDSVYTGAEDEQHGWSAITLDKVENSWVRRVTVTHFGYAAVVVRGGSRAVTIEDSAMLDPISQVTGGRRYPFAIDSGYGVLVQRCYARQGRHSFVTGARVTGPHVFLDSLAEQTRGDDGPHHRWATGILFDNTKSGQLYVQNRTDWGSGHGWAGAQVMFWNAHATMIADAPQHAMNWTVGCTGEERDGVKSPKEPKGIWESFGERVMPRSLYLQQLQDRLGEQAVERITVPLQREGRLWEALSAWAGEGALRDQL